MSLLKKTKIMLMAAFILGMAAKPSFSAIFNVASDFSLTNNPNGAWRYGWSSSLGSNFNLYSNVGKVTPTIDLWYDSTKNGSPLVLHNSTATEDNSHPTITFQPNQLGFHPGYYGEYSIVRWIAPEAATYSLATMFTGLDHVGPTTTDVHVLHNNILLFSNLINGFGASSSKSFATAGTVRFRLVTQLILLLVMAATRLTCTIRRVWMLLFQRHPQPFPNPYPNLLLY
jgi:hypothetical protein